MLNGINFTGREEMLTAGIKKAQQGYIVHTATGEKALPLFVSEGTIFPKEDVEQVARIAKKAIVAPSEVERHPFISQTELVSNVIKPAQQDAEVVAETSPHGISFIA